MIVREHHVNFLLHLVESGLVDSTTWTIHPQLTAAVDSSLVRAVDSTQLARSPVNDLQVRVLDQLQTGPLSAGRVDSRSLRALENRGLVERYVEADANVIRQAFGRPELAVDKPVSLVRLTEAGRALAQRRG